MEDDKPFLVTDQSTNQRKSNITTRPRSLRSKFWRRSAIALPITIAVLLSPMLIVFILAATIDPLYGWLLIPALIPTMVAAVLTIVGGVLAAVFLATQKPTTNEKLTCVITITFSTIVLFGAFIVFPNL